MSEMLIKHFSIPSNCMECEWRDAEACGECELMIGNPFPTFEEQFAHCPFRVIAKRHPLVPVPKHGRLIDADVLKSVLKWHHSIFIGAEDKVEKAQSDALICAISEVVNAPTIIEAEEGE